VLSRITKGALGYVLDNRASLTRSAAPRINAGKVTGAHQCRQSGGAQYRGAFDLEYQ